MLAGAVQPVEDEIELLLRVTDAKSGAELSCGGRWAGAAA